MKYEYSKFLPLLLLYLFAVVLLSSNNFQSDEESYILNANRLVHGVYSSQGGDNLWFGPGYPIVLMPFVFWKLPLFSAKLLNSFFLFGAILYFYKTLSNYIKKDYAVLLTYCLGLYPPLMREIHLLMTESLTIFLICGFMFHFCKLYQSSSVSRSHVVAASLYLGYLALTKVIFGYVISFGIFLFLFLLIWQRKEWFQQTAFIYILALIWCIPYLIVTYSLTDKLFYWGSSGGLSLYWMSTPYNGELGDWLSGDGVEDHPELSQHIDFFETIKGLSTVERDDAFKNQAILNIINHPKKYGINWVANIGRLLFSYPYSYTPQKLSTYFYIMPNMFIVVFLVLSIYPAILRYRSIPYEIYTLILFALIAFLGTSLLSGFDRQFRPLVPIIILWLAFIYFRVLKIELRPKPEKSLG